MSRNPSHPPIPSRPARSEDADPLGRRAADSGERAYRSLRRMLFDFRLKPEERINEVHLARSLGLSRTPIREALNRLASEGFLDLTPNRGFHVRPLSSKGMIDLYELRMLIECAAFRLMCERAGDSQIDRLCAFWTQAEPRCDGRDPDLILQLDEGFHRLIAEGSGNPEILHLLDQINARIRLIRRVQIEHGPHRARLIDAHRAIADAARRRDAETGVALLATHLRMTLAASKQALHELMLKLYAPNGGPGQDPQD